MLSEEVTLVKGEPALDSLQVATVQFGLCNLELKISKPTILGPIFKVIRSIFKYVYNVHLSTLCTLGALCLMTMV